MATIQIGTYDLASLRANRFTSVADFGEDRLQQVIESDLAAHNAVVQEMLADLAERTTDRQRIYGASIGGSFQEVDEYSRVATQKNYGGSTVGFPLRMYAMATGWTARAMAKMSVGDAAEKALMVEQAHVRKIRYAIKTALYLSANYTFRDSLGVPVVDLAVKRLVNADSMTIPNAPDGSTFNGATHTHYSAINGLTAGALKALVTNVTEHGNGGRIIIAIHHTDADTVAVLSGFVAAQIEGIVPATNAAYAQQSTNPTNQFDRYLGKFNGAEVWIKPWAIASYALCYDAMATEKPLVYRIDDTASQVGLRLVAEHTVHPLSTAHYEDLFGVGVWGRTSAAVLYFGGGSYTDPTITE